MISFALLSFNFITRKREKKNAVLKTENNRGEQSQLKAFLIIASLFNIPYIICFPQRWWWWCWSKKVCCSPL